MARILGLIFLAALGTGTGLPAQRPDSAATCPGCPPRRVGLAIGGMIASNVVVWSFNRFVMDEEWARVSPASWKRNWDLGFEFDPDQFITNQFLHPYQGSQYFNAGRANGLSFWESTPLAILGSLQWEYMGETFRPSLNDFFTTSLGGIALGEVTHHLATLVRDNGLSGWPRTWREVAAGVLDPAGFFIRLATGESRRQGPNPVERRPELLHTTGQAGFARVANVGNLDAAQTVVFLVLELRHGESFDQPYARPWDTFVIRTEVRVGARMDLAGLQAQGRLFSTELGRRAGGRHLLEVTQDFDYLRNVAFTYGAQSAAASLRSRFGGGGRSEFLTELSGRLIILGAINSDYAQSTGREYDYGPGFGVGATAAWRHNERDLLRASYGVNWLHTVNGSDGDHFAQLLRIEARAPVHNDLGIGADALLYVQNSLYERVPNVRQSHPQVRLYLAWFPE